MDDNTLYDIIKTSIIFKKLYYIPQAQSATAFHCNQKQIIVLKNFIWGHMTNRVMTDNDKTRTKG